MEFFLDRYNYWVCIVLMMIGFYGMIADPNLIKKVIGLNIFQTAVLLFFITVSARKDGTLPILLANGGEVFYANPLPHVIVLTAIVVGVSVTAVALALIIRIHRAYGTIDENKIAELEQKTCSL
jgi:multicomponent Na+:H+ antiporter subunit C